MNALRPLPISLILALTNLGACASSAGRAPLSRQTGAQGDTQVTLQLSRDPRSLNALRAQKEATAARADLLARKDLSETLLSSVAELSFLAGRSEDAAREARALLKRDLKNVEAMKTLLKCSLFQGRLDEALLIANNALGLSPRDPDLFALRGLVHYGLGDTVDAREDWKRGLALNPTHIPSQMNLATLYFQNRFMNLAGSGFERVLAIQPENLDAQVGRALVLNAQGNGADARTRLAAILENHPKNQLVLYNLAMIERDRFQNYEVALKHIERYLELGGQDRTGLERALAHRDALRNLVLAKKTRNLSDDELREMANRTSQAAGAVGEDGSSLTAGRPQNVSGSQQATEGGAAKDGAAAAPVARRGDERGAPGKARSGGNGATAGGESAPKSSGIASPMNTDDAAALEEAIK